MKVVNNDQTFFVDWKYSPSAVDATTVDCVLRNKEGEILDTAVIKRHKNDVHDKEKARRYSLAKLLNVIAPGPEGKKMRTDFWNAYIGRNHKLEVHSDTELV
jgi:hypothetical protein